MRSKSLFIIAFLVFIFFLSPCVYASTATLNGTAYFYSQVGDSLTGVGTGYDSSFNDNCVLNSTTSFCSLHKADLTANKTYFYPVKQIGVVNTNYSYKAQTYYTIRIDFYAVQGQISRTYTQWHVNVDNSISCDANATCNVSWETNNSYYTAVISYYSTTAHTGSLYDLGSVNNANQTLFVNSSTSTAGSIYIRAATITEVDSSDQETINAINNQTTIINNNLNSIGSDIVDMNDYLHDSNIGNDLADGVFDNMDFYENAQLSSVITSPINFIRSFTNECSPIQLPITLGQFSNTVVLQCGTTLFWGRGDVANFRSIWNVIFGGFLIYKLTLLLFKRVSDAIDPKKDDIGGV